MWGRTGTNWDWYGANADQGLIYYWMKYVKKSVSLIIRHEVEQWEADVNGRLQRDENLYPKMLDNYGCASNLAKKVGWAPHSDYVHLTGRSKPWNSNREDLEMAITTKSFQNCTDVEKWYYSLVEALKEIDVYNEVSLEFILGTHESPAVGTSPSFQQMAQYLYDKRLNGWKQYENEFDEPEVIQSLTSR
jgi:hypothetical protein